MTERIECTCKLSQKVINGIKNWKEKAVNRNKKIIALEKQLRETRDSRDAWKAKYKQSQLLCKEYKRALSKSKQYEVTVQSVKNHSYDLFMMSLSLDLKQAGQLSLRSCLSVLEVIVKTFNLDLSS